MPKKTKQQETSAKRKRQNDGTYATYNNHQGVEQVQQEQSKTKQFFFVYENIMLLLQEPKSKKARGPYKKKKKGILNDVSNVQPIAVIDNHDKVDNDGTASDDEYYSDNETAEIPKIDLKDLKNVRDAYEKLENLLVPRVGQQHQTNNISYYEMQKYSSAKHYFEFLLKKQGKMEASKIATEIVWGKHASEDYRPKVVRSWAREYLQFQIISPHQQGKHAKRISILVDEDLKSEVVSWILSCKIEKRTLKDICSHVNKTIIPRMLGAVGNVDSMQMKRYIEHWGFSHKGYKKDVYFDGHEHEDVKAYRAVWAPQMMQWSKRMEDYEGESLENVVERQEKTEKKLVMVTHDESTFYCQDTKYKVWTYKEESVIRKKGMGSSIMASEFQCPCHGTMRWPEKNLVSRKIIHPGAGRVGYWKSEDMVNQLKEVIQIFDHLHPDCQALFLFDQSSNHKAFSPDALRINNINPNPSEVKKDVVLMRNGWYMAGSDRIEQSLYERKNKIVANDNGVTEELEYWELKGARKILQERGLGRWEEYKSRNELWKFKCGEAKGVEGGECCGYYMLGMQPDFLEQKSALEEVITGTEKGHIMSLYPKFHCEINWIERYWSCAKHKTRTNCDYSFKSLKKDLPCFLDSICPEGEPPTKIRRFYQRCWRFIKAYSEDPFNGQDAYNSVARVRRTKSLKSHAKIGEND